MSYEAAVRHLANLEVVDRGEEQVLLKARPLAIKTNLARGNPPLNARADVWLVDEHWNGASLQVNQDDEVLVQLPENRTTGYRWQSPREISERDRQRAQPTPPSFTDRNLEIGASGPMHSETGGSVATPSAAVSTAHALTLSLGPQNERLDLIGPPGPVELVRDQYAASWTTADTPVEVAAARSELIHSFAPRNASGDRRQTPPNAAHDQSQLAQVGGTGHRYLTLRALGPAQVTITLTYASRFDASSPPAASFALNMTIESPRRVMSLQQLIGSGGSLVAGIDGS